MQPNTNNLVTEIILGVVAGLIAIAAPLLLYLGKVDFAGAMGIWALAAGLVVGKLALNAPSPSQQAQIGAQQSQVLSQQQQLQQLVSYALGMVSGLVQQPQAPVAPPQAQQTTQPNVGVASGQVAHVLATPPEVTLTPIMPNSSVVSNPAATGTTTPPTPTQFKTITIPDVSMPTIPVVGQGIPLGQ